MSASCGGCKSLQSTVPWKTSSQHASRKLNAARMPSATAQPPRIISLARPCHPTGPTVAFQRRGMLSEHEHGLFAFLVELLEQDQRFLLQPQTPLLIAIDDVQRVVLPIGNDVVLFESCWQHLFAGVLHRYSERFEYFHARAAPGVLGLVGLLRGLRLLLLGLLVIVSWGLPLCVSSFVKSPWRWCRVAAISIGGEG